MYILAKEQSANHNKMWKYKFFFLLYTNMIALFEDTPVYFLASISRSSEVLPKDEERFLFNRCQRRTKRYSRLFLTSIPLAPAAYCLTSTAPNAKGSAVDIVVTTMFCSLRCPMVIFPSFPSFMVYAFALLHSGLDLKEKKCDFEGSCTAVFASKGKTDVF